MVFRCYFASVLRILGNCSPVGGSAAKRHLQLHERQVYSVAKLCPHRSLLLCHIRNVAGLSILYKVNSYCNHCLFSELPSASTKVRHTRYPLEFEVSRCKELPNLQGVSCRPRFECGMTFPTLCLIPGRWMRSRVQSTVVCFPELCFLHFSVA